MARRFQVSIRRLLVSTAVICMAAASLAASRFPSDDGNPFLLIASTIVFSIGLGILVRRPMLFALVPIVIWAAISAYFIFIFWDFEV